jgi:hypothetical protein
VKIETNDNKAPYVPIFTQLELLFVNSPLKKISAAARLIATQQCKERRRFNA